MSTDSHIVEIHAASRPALEEQLEAAVQRLQVLAAKTPTRGILITRHQSGRYTARLSEQVPYGITHEQYR